VIREVKPKRVVNLEYGVRGMNEVVDTVQRRALILILLILVPFKS
jgi:hypothetical protein